MKVRYHPEAEQELVALSPNERVAILSSVEKLKALGDQLPFPHSSEIRGAKKLRELRPRAGRSAWRVIYRRVSDTMVIAAIAPEAQSDQRRFARAISRAEKRLDEIRET